MTEGLAPGSRMLKASSVGLNGCLLSRQLLLIGQKPCRDCFTMEMRAKTERKHLFFSPHFTPLLLTAFVKTLETAFPHLDSNLISPICRLRSPFQAFVSVPLLPVSTCLLAFERTYNGQISPLFANIRRPGPGCS